MAPRRLGSHFKCTTDAASPVVDLAQPIPWVAQRSSSLCWVLQTCAELALLHALTPFSRAAV
eukprot:3621333-Amphidinium_carterae.1